MLGEWGALARLVERFEKVLTPPLEDPADSYYAWLPYPVGLFLEGLHTVQRQLVSADHWGAGGTFLDVGCGIGTKMALASYTGWRVKGVELYPEYAAVARQLLPQAPIMVTNAMIWEDYQADLVYSYRLCTDEDDQRTLTRHITDHMTSGSTLFLAGCPDPEGPVTPIAPNLWRIP